MALFISFILVFFGLYIPSFSIAATLPAQSTVQPQVDYSSMREEITHLITKKMQKNSITGLSIAVVDNQKTVWAEGFGWADKKNNIAATPKTVYRIGSITKLFTVTAAMQLVEEGKMALDQPLQVVLPQFSIRSRTNDADKITIRNIMTHHSGLPTNYMHGMWSEKPEDFTRLVDLLGDEYTAYPPDTIFCYSNIGMTLLGHAVQEVAGQPYGELITRKLLRPLGMHDSYIAQQVKDDSQSSKGYSDNVESLSMPLRDLPAGGLNSTVLDLASFAKMVFADGRSGRQQIVQAETLDEMLRFQDGTAPFDLGNQIGLGWFLVRQKSENGGLKALHGGDTFLFHSMLVTLPEYQLAVIVLANSESSGGVVAELAEDTLQAALAVKAGIKITADKTISLEELPATPEDLKTLPGYYSSDEGLLQITRKNDQLKLISNDDTLNLILHQDGQYYLQYKLLGLFSIDLEGLDEFGITHAEIHGREVLVGTFRGQKIIFGEKIIPDPMNALWQPRTGRYEIINPSPGVFYKNIELGLENDFLVLRYAIQLPHQKKAGEAEQVVLQVINGENAVIHGLGTGLGDTIRIVHQHGDELLSWSGFRFRRVK
jgi:CubicO group peptidase (beta-lactamase class C family)